MSFDSTTDANRLLGDLSNRASNLHANDRSSIHVGHIFQSKDSSKTLQQRQTEILAKLCRLPYKDLKNRNPRPTAGTCHWVSSHDRFSQWAACKSPSLLLVSADPGRGKSVLARHMVDTALPAKISATKVCYFFFKEGYLDQDRLPVALCCLLHQIFGAKRELLDEATCQRFETYGESTYESISDLWEVLNTAARHESSGEIVCVLDAFDECITKDRSQLPILLRDLCQNASETKLKFLITSRPYHADLNLFRGFEHFLISGEDNSTSKTIAKEVKTTIEYEIEKVATTMELLPSEKCLLQRKLLEKDNRTYLWVHVVLKMIEAEVFDTSTIETITSSIPPSVDELYEKILKRCKDHTQARKLLNIVLAAVRPLKLDEIIVALRVEKGHRSLGDLEILEGQRLVSFIRNLCGLFVVIVDGFVYLLHQTAREFLVRATEPPLKPIDADFVWKGTFDLEESHRILAYTCTRHLLFDEFFKSGNNKGFPKFMKQHKFLDYSGRYWDLHWRACHFNFGSAPELQDTMSALCQMERKEHLWYDVHCFEMPILQATSLDVAAYCGLLPVIELLSPVRAFFKSQPMALSEEKSQRPQRTPETWALHFAADQGHTRAVQSLLTVLQMHLKRSGPSTGSFVSINDQDHQGRTPLVRAVINGHREVVDALVSAGANADTKDKFGGTAMSYAMCIKAQDIKAAIMRVGGDESATSLENMLCGASKSGDKQLVDFLLQSGRVNVNCVGQSGRTPLYEVVFSYFSRHHIDWNIRIEVLDTLIAKGAVFSPFVGGVSLGDIGKFEDEPRFMNLFKHTVEQKMGSLFRTFLSRGLKADYWLLEWLLFLGYDADAIPSIDMLRLVLGGGASPDPDPSSLVHPTYSLLARVCKRVSWKSTYREHYEKYAELLLEHGARPDGVPVEGYQMDPTYSPLYQSIGESGSKPLTEMLLQYGARPRYPPTTLTPLHFATCSTPWGFPDRRDIAHLLLKSEAEIEGPTLTGLTPLHLAANGSHHRSAEELILKGADARAMSSFNITPWDRFNKTMIAMLGNDTRNAKQKLPALYLAIQNGDVEELEQLIGERTDKNISLRNGNGPLHSVVAFTLRAGAQIERAIPMLRLLCESKHHTFDINARNCLGQTPLHLAAFFGDSIYRVVEFLLERGADPLCSDVCGRLPIFYVPKSNTNYVSASFATRYGDKSFLGEMTGQSLLASMDRIEPAARNWKDNFGHSMNTFEVHFFDYKFHSKFSR